MPRIIFPADTAPEVLAAWLRDAQAARYIGEIELPIVRRAPPPPAAPPPLLFARLPEQRRGEPMPDMDPPKPKPGPKSIAEIALGSGILKLRKPTAPDIAEVNTAIMEALPPGVPTYAKEVLAVHRKRGTTGVALSRTSSCSTMPSAGSRSLAIPGARVPVAHLWHRGHCLHWDDSARGGSGSSRRSRRPRPAHA